MSQLRLKKPTSMILRPINSAILLSLCMFSSLVLAANTSGSRIKLNNALPHLKGTIQVDATLDEAVWKQALRLTLDYETSPAENAKPEVETEVFLFENGEFLYVAFNAHDPDPSKIRDYLTDRDNIWDSDFVGIKFDTFGESRKAFQFFVNALGVQGDATQEDFRGDDTNWDVIWDSAGRVTETGYVVEMAIPFRALRFPEVDGQQIWPFELTRFYPRQHRHRFANTPVDRDVACNICQFDSIVGMETIKPSKNLTVVPTLVLARSDSRDNNQTSWQSGDAESEFGLDLRWGITQDTVLNATINPDFSQVEADAAQIDINNPFALFLQEKRPFFLDGSDYFNTQTNLFYSRNVNQPNYGAKITGQTDGHSYGFITVDDKSTRLLLPGRLGSSIVELEDVNGIKEQESDNLIARYSYDLGDKNQVGFLYTDRSAGDYQNSVLSIDGKYWFDQYHSLAMQWVTTETDNAQNLIDDHQLSASQSGDAKIVNFRHDSRNWWGYLNFVEYDPEFRADLGFISQVDYEKTIVGLGHRWYPENENSLWTRIEFGGDWDATYDSNDIKLEEEIEASFFISGRHQSSLRIGVVSREKRWESDDLSRSELFDESFYFINSSIEPISGLKLSLGNDYGDFIDYQNGEIGKRTGYYPSINWQINQNWLTKLDYEYINFDNSDGNLFVAKVINLRATYQMNIRSYLRFTLQQLNLEEATPRKNQSTQLLYSYKINPKTLFFAGYSDNGFVEGNTNDFRNTGRSVFMKFSYAWQY